MNQSINQMKAFFSSIFTVFVYYHLNSIRLKLKPRASSKAWRRVINKFGKDTQSRNTNSLFFMVSEMFLWMVSRFLPRVKTRSRILLSRSNSCKCDCWGTRVNPRWWAIIIQMRPWKANNIITVSQRGAKGQDTRVITIVNSPLKPTLCSEW